MASPARANRVRQERHAHAAGLHVPHPADHGPHAGPVEGIQADGNVPQVRVIPAAPEQNAAPKGVFGALLPAHGPEELHRHQALLEAGVTDEMQPHPRKKFRCFDHRYSFGFENTRLLYNHSPQIESGTRKIKEFLVAIFSFMEYNRIKHE